MYHRSVGLHARDTTRLIRILKQLRDAGNTVVVVEHESSIMRAADQIIDIGPGHGATGGEVVFQGGIKELLTSKRSLTGEYLSGRRKIESTSHRSVVLKSGKPTDTAFLTLEHLTCHNLEDLTVHIPLNRLVCLTGVSGSGKTTLVRDLLVPLLTTKLAQSDGDEAMEEPGSDDSENKIETGGASTGAAEIKGWETLGKVLLVDQSALGKTPRSNPAVYIGAFDDIREVMALSETASQQGLNASAFSFNSSQGQCEKCRGAGFEKIEMQFLSDIFVRCPECEGRRYRPHILEVKVTAPKSKVEWSIADFLDATVDEAVDFLEQFEGVRPALRAAKQLRLLQDVGLGYLRLGQPINTLSGGESQRVKLVRHLAESNGREADSIKPTLFVFDEPTTGLHFEDVRILLLAFQKMVDAGHSVLIIEHNLEMIQAADWVIDLGPEAGASGGKIVAEGTPEMIAKHPTGHTGKALRENALRTA